MVFPTTGRPARFFAAAVATANSGEGEPGRFATKWRHCPPGLDSGLTRWAGNPTGFLESPLLATQALPRRRYHAVTARSGRFASLEPPVSLCVPVARALILQKTSRLGACVRGRAQVFRDSCQQID